MQYKMKAFGGSIEVQRKTALNMIQQGYKDLLIVRDTDTQFDKVRTARFTYRRTSEYMNGDAMLYGNSNARRLGYVLQKIEPCDISIVYGADCFCYRCQGKRYIYVHPDMA